MTTQNFHIGTHPLIESIQICTAQLADEFQRMWQRGIDYIRFELISLPGDSKKTVAVDFILRSADGKYVLNILGILAKEDGTYFPLILKNWDQANIAFLHDTIMRELQKPTKNLEVRQLSLSPAIPLSEITEERAVPGAFPYITTVQHVKRYKFLLDFIRPGKILECACGAGYGAMIFSRLDTVTEYYGVDLSEVAVAYSKSNTWDERFSFHEVDLTKQTPSLYENIVSLETIEHVPNPYQFMELLIEKMAPDGQLLISIPHEISCGSHLNPYHFSNWNYKRLINFLEQYFEEITVFPQERGTLEAGTFEASEIFNRTPNEDHDEFFIVILRRPCKKKRPNIILRRSKALGDVIWATPILRELRHYYPCHNVLVSTERTDVFIHNTDADLVFNLQYKFLPDDLLVNLDETREMFRELHPLHAYAKASGIPLTLTQPTLYLTSNEFRLCAAHVLHHFKNLDTERIIAVHMTATSLDRTWSKKYWQQLISNLLQQDKKLGIVILGYGQDFSAADTGFSTNRRVLCLVRQLSLMRTAAVLSLCDLLITPNSEVLHIAAAVSVSYLGLFNTADHTACLPFTAGSRAIRADLECRGCLQNIAYTEAPPCPSGHPDCIERIFPEEVQAMTIRMLEAVTPGGWKTRCRMAIPNKQ